MLLYQAENGFLFNSDSHFLYHFIAQFSPKGTLLDVGCGCGILGLLLARDFPITLHAIDIQAPNITLTQHNARVNHIPIHTYHDDLLSWKSTQKFDTIIANPPYYHDGVSRSNNSHLHQSRYSQHLPFEKMLAKLNQHIAPRGSFIFCYDAKQLPMLLATLTRYKFIVEDIRAIHGTAQKPSHLIMIHAKKGSKALCKLHPPLIHFENDTMSDEAQNIYQKTRTYSIKCNLS